MGLNKWIKNYSRQIIEAGKLNKENEINDSFFTVAPINDRYRCAFIEGFGIAGNCRNMLYKMKSIFDKTGIYLVRVVHAESNTTYIFTLQP